MDHPAEGIPKFVEEPERPLTWEERALVEELLRGAPPGIASHISALRVVGRCGCGECPTVFFRRPAADAQGRRIASFTGTDDEEGITGVTLWQSRGQLAQLEFWSVDGHEPFSAPSIATLKRL
ncbi:DUF6984 family protein [Ramlibacter albus]|uniref:DUF6984 domain-containing protein n=1 Tax=Ramlibacter albus TaxID=2079448 RepID=A0A923S1Q4_9BURK|nr:hypothetical protein [Ramlibacter albus]MBC5764674.1 hypothetical protein [Ramlibacter albus]